MKVSAICKRVLKNGLTVLIYPMYTIPKVTIQLWYGVGSKNEEDGERGLAHLLEHMIFKGTDVLSESDIKIITHKLSGSCNAFTSFDYTGYTFDFPKQNWKNALLLLANCMRNCSFKQDLLNAELKAVIQELKMYKDDYQTTLNEKLVSTIFSEHPYHYPIIGFKQDLWNIDRDKLLAFYQKHYIPNNATLIIVGDIDSLEAFEHTEKAFSGIVPDLMYKHTNVAQSWNFSSKAIKMYRDVQQSRVSYVWILPGLKNGNIALAYLTAWMLAQGKGSRLYKKLVTELALANDVEAELYDLFDYSIFFVHVEPTLVEYIDAIKKVISDEVMAIAGGKFTIEEVTRAYKQHYMEYVAFFESNSKLANEIGKFYLATKDESLFFSHLSSNIPEYYEQLKPFLQNYLNVVSMHEGILLPLEEKEKKLWTILQEQSDREDEIILCAKVRESTVECGIFVEKITVNEPVNFTYPKAQKMLLPNGAQLVWHSTAHTPKVDIILDLKAKYFYDSDQMPGLFNCMSSMLLEGTQNYPDQTLMQEAEAAGITIESKPGLLYVSALKEDIEFALTLLSQIVSKPKFTVENLEKIKTHAIADIYSYWDEPSLFCDQILRSHLYKNHPYSKNFLGTQESVAKITLKQVQEIFNQYITPVGARLAIVGDLEGIAIQKLVEDTLQGWHGPLVQNFIFPPLLPLEQQTVDYFINRDQMLLCFGIHSVARLDPLYDSLFLFDQAFTGGVLGSMNSYLFELREQTGLFYTIGGSLVSSADEEPGCAIIKTIVSNDRLKEAEILIEETIKNAHHKVTYEDLEYARNIIVNTMVDNFESNAAMAQAFLFLERFNLSDDYFDKRLMKLKLLTLEQIKDAVKKLTTKPMLKLKIGRL